MKNHAEESIFTKRGLVIGFIFYFIYGVIFFSMDPEWVAWAGPMILGALYVPNSPPPLFSDPKTAFQMASLFSLLSLAVLMFLMPMMGKAQFGWLTWLTTRVRSASLRGLAKPVNGQTSEREPLRWTLISGASNDSITASTETCDPAAVGQEVSLPFLTKGELVQGISKAELQKISSLCSEKRCPRGTSIFSESDPSDSLYIVKSGLVKLTSHSAKGMETILHILKPDEIFGELLLSEDKRPFGAVAIEDAIVTAISRDHFLQLLTAVPTVALNFIRLLSKRLTKVEKGLAESSHSWSYHRLAKVLLKLAEDHGVENPVGTLIPIRLTHEDLANLIGTTRETVTTQLRKFERMGLLNRQERHLIVSRPRLTEFIHSEEVRFSNLHS